MTAWKSECESLNRFISENPDIVVNASEISIPRHLRDEFYARFDKTRAALVAAHYPELPVDVDTLSRNYLEIEKEIIALLRIERIAMPMDLFTLMHTPKEGLARIIYGKLFDLLQGKTSSDLFEDQCVHDLKISCAELFRLGYEWWAALVLIKLLEPDEAFGVDLDDDYKPFLTELKEISFGRQAHHPTIRIPEFVVHSRKLGKLAAIKMAIKGEVEDFGVRLKPPVRPKKRTGDTSFALDSRIMLLSLLSGPDEIPIITDIFDRTLTSPDFMVECITGEEAKDPNALEQVKLHVASMNPKLGMSLLVVEGNVEGAMEALPENVRPLSAGFDQSKLQAVISSLV